MKQLWIFSAAITLSLIFAVSSIAGTYSSDFEQYLNYNQSEEMVGAIITLSDQVDLNALKAELYAQRADRREWHEAVVLALQEKATQTQTSILAQLDELVSQGLVEDYRGLWIANLVLVTATEEALDILVARDDVLQINPEHQIESIKPVDEGGDQPLIAGVEIGLERINAPECWAMGITGSGRLVSHLDTGVDGWHPALNERWRGYDVRYADNPEWAWFDPVTNTMFPFDAGQHGTHTMGTICGLGAETGDTVGVAFGAEWVSAGVIDRVSIPQTVADALLSFEWLVDPDGDPATVWDVPDVCSNSWGVTTGHGYPPCDQTFWTALDGLEAAGCVVVFAAGNEGPGANSLRRPSDRATTPLATFSVGALDGNNENLPIASFSSRGPSYCTDDGEPTFKPEVSAPGVNVRSSVPGGSYQGGWSGTSMACPHVAGVIALMRQANPNLTTDLVKQIIMDTADDLGAEGEDNDYGMGIINAYECVIRSLAYLEGWGTLAGQITDEASGDPLQGAIISVLERPWAASSNSEGWYYLFMPADTLFDIRVDYPPTHLPIFDAQMVAENETLFVDYALEGKVSVTLRVSFGNPGDIDYRSFFLNGTWDNDGFYDGSWSGDLIEIKDDGIEPDETAEDGIFTGGLLLARDTENDYEWAVYTEDYNLEAARLAYGATFTIPDLNPPVVPMLEPNPSGSDNNFVFSAEGDNGLSLDLMAGIDNTPSKWGASDSLYEGVTYTFLFHTMHSDLVTYGSGGVGGTSLTFTPEVDGPYDFIFNDMDDSYIVQLTGTEGPPGYLSAQSGFDGHIPVGWLPPGVTESNEMAYDDGQLENAYYYYDAANLMATMFVPESYPVSIDSVMIHVLTEGDPYWPWPDGNHDPIGISIYIDDGTGMPQLDPVFYTEATAELGQWIRVNAPEIVVTTGNFWVAMNNLYDTGPYDGIGLDLITDYPANKWTREYDVWGPMDTYAGDHMIRCKVFGGGASSWVGFDDATPAGAISSDAIPRGNSDLMAGTGQAAKAEPATQMPLTPDYMAYHPRILGERPLITDTQVLAGYNLYRDISPAPFDRDLMINDELITETMYDDWGADPYGPIVNGVLYYYQASAVYDIGEGQFVEVGPSNEATGMAENHPPEAPENLVGDVDDHTVNLSWDPNTDYDIMGYNIYRRDYNQSDFNLVGSVMHPTTSYSEVITVDGIYRYKIKAVDTGEMESENFSNYVDMPVGLIPPGQLRASDNKEFKIELSWRNPGGVISDVQDLNIGVVISDYVGAEAELVDFLINSGEVTSATVIDAQNNTPVFEDLEPYDMLVVWTNYAPMDGAGLGNALADYAETGKGVLLLEFAFTEIWGVQGRIMAEYSPFGNAASGYIDVNLGEYDEGHPMMDGVTTLSDYYVFDVPVQNNAEVVAMWDNGWPAVAVNSDNPNVACINGYVGVPNHQFGGDMLQLVLNGVMYVGSGSGIEPDGFTLYKADDEAGPFTEIGSFPGETHDYDDYPVPNGVEYWYMVTAIWDGEESDPSNVAMGVAMNYPPESPYDLTAEAVGQNVNLDWEFDDLMGDFDHHNVYRRLMPDGEWEYIGECEPSEYVDVIEEGNDGTYGYRVTAVDTGDPELESEISNTAYALVGHVPPTSLTALSRHESRVPLSWNLPGTWAAGRDIRRDMGENPIITSHYRELNDGSTLDLSYKGLVGPTYPPVILDEGGPDEFGYTWIDSDEPGGPHYEWRDITGIGEPIPISGDDQNLGPFDLGFDFPFYGNVFSTFNICGNGWLSFTSMDAVYWNQPIPNPDAPENLIAPFWDDLYPPNGGEFWYYSDGSECVVSYINVPHIGSGGPYTFQVIFRSTGTIIFQYDVMNPETNSATVGIQNADGTIGLQVAFDQDYIHDQLAVRMGTSPDGIPPVHYNLYRSETSPVPVDVDHLITSDIDGELTNYIDEDGLVNGTTYYYVMTATWPDSVASPASNEAEATPLLGGRLAADPTEIEANNDESEVVIVPLTLSNAGGIPVNFHIAANSEAITIGESQRPETPEFTRYEGNDDKSNLPQDPEYPPVITDQGGPDAFGYVWIDSDEANGPHYDWVDITGIGIPIFMSDDDNQGPFPMEFAFPFYDQVFWDFRICSNGWISFTSTDYIYWNGPLPDPSAPENMIAPFWDDLNPSTGGSIFYYTSADSVVVSWIDVPHYSTGGPYTYQIILTSNGVITYQYQYMMEPTNSATVGIQNATMDIGLQIAFDQAYIHDEMAIRINAGWLSVDPAQGTIAAGSDFEVDVIMDATLLEDGVHEGLLHITAWDENVDVPSVDVPVNFWVDHTAIDDNNVLLPQEFALNQNYPNPFNAQTEIRYALPVDSDVQLEVYNILGQKVASLVDGKKEAGYHMFIWDGTSTSGEVVASGMYLYKLVTNEKTFVRKMLMLK